LLPTSSNTKSSGDEEQDWPKSRILIILGGVLSAHGRQLLIGAGITSALITGLDQRSALGTSSPVPMALMDVGSVLIEQVVIVAAVSALLSAARRPAWEIYAIVGLVETVLHCYMGVSAVPLGFYAAGHLWLYRRYRAIAPLALAHAVYNIGVVEPKLWAPAPYPNVISALVSIVVAAGVARGLDRSPAPRA
jgi:hypothetical protein